MTENQKKIITKLKWIIYPVALLLPIDFFIKFFKRSPLETAKESNRLFDWIDQSLGYVVLIVVAIGVIALIQQFFTKELIQKKNTRDAARAKLLLRIEVPNQLAGSLILFVVAVGFSVFLNIMLFSPNTFFEQEQLDGFKLFEKLIFGFFYTIAHFLVIVFGQRLFKGMPPVFIATEKGFCYEPAGISTGWVLWEDIQEVRESSVLYGSGVNNGPALMPVLGIKLINPKEYNAAAYAPLLQLVVKWGQKLNNYQTEGVGDILLRPSDFGDQYDKVKEIFKIKSKTAFDYHSLVD